MSFEEHKEMRADQNECDIETAADVAELMLLAIPADTSPATRMAAVGLLMRFMFEHYIKLPVRVRAFEDFASFTLKAISESVRKAS